MIWVTVWVIWRRSLVVPPRLSGRPVVVAVVVVRVSLGG